MSQQTSGVCERGEMTVQQVFINLLLSWARVAVC